MANFHESIKYHTPLGNKITFCEPNPRVEIVEMPLGGFLLRKPGENGHMQDVGAFTNVADLTAAIPAIFATVVKEKSE